jgi:Conjugative transposon protein TcpC
VIRGPARPALKIETRPLWRIRLAGELPRYLLCAMSIAGLVASARYAIAPPRTDAHPPARPAPQTRDPAGEGYAVLFARSYLTWNAAEPQDNARALAAFAAGGLEQDAGLQLPASGQQRVEWAEVVQERTAVHGEHVYTVAAQTDAAGLLYLTVTVARRADGSLALGGYPAFVGAPAAGPAQLSEALRQVVDQGLTTVVERALRNYLADSATELAADLTGGARVSLPATALSLDSVKRLDWLPGAASVLAVVQAHDARGVQYTLAYELDVARQQARWEVSAVQMDPLT